MELAANPEEFFANYYLGVIHMQRGELASPPSPSWRRPPASSPTTPTRTSSSVRLTRVWEATSRRSRRSRKAIAFNPRLDHNDYQVTNAHYRLGQSLMKAGRDRRRASASCRSPPTSSPKPSRRMRRSSTPTSTRPVRTSRASLPELVSTQGCRRRAVRRPGRTRRRAEDDASLGTPPSTRRWSRRPTTTSVCCARSSRTFARPPNSSPPPRKWNPQHEGLDYNLGLAYFKSESYKEAVAAARKRAEGASRPTYRPSSCWA